MLQLRRPVFAVNAVVLAGLLVMGFAVPIAVAAGTNARSVPKEVAEQNADLMALRNVFRTRTVLALVSEVAFFTPETILSDPYLARYMELQGKYDLHPLAARIRSQAFDIVVTARIPRGYRGINYLSPTLRAAVHHSYEPLCAKNNWVMLLRRGAPPSGTMAAQLIATGCDTSLCDRGSYCRSW